MGQRELAVVEEAVGLQWPEWLMMMMMMMYIYTV